MKLFISALALLAVAGCATNNSNYGFRGVASNDLVRNVNAYAKEFPVCVLGEYGDGLRSSTPNRKCVLGAIAHELKLTVDAGIKTATVENYVDTFINLENAYAGSTRNQATATPSIDYHVYQTQRAAIKAYREGELAARAIALQTANAISQVIEAENAAEVSKNIDESVAANNREQKRIKLQQMILSKKSELSNYESVERFLELRQEFRKAQLKDINSKARQLNALSKKIEATFATLSRRYDGTDKILNAILGSLQETAKKTAAIENRIQKGLDQYEKTCSASKRSVKKAFGGQTRGCVEALDILKKEIRTVDNLVSVTDAEIAQIKEVIKAKTAELNAAGTPQLQITQKAADKAKDSVLGYHTSQLSILEATKAELKETKVTVQSLVSTVEGQIAEFNADEEAFMAKQEAAMAARQAALDSLRHTYRIRGEALESLYNDVEADKAASPEAGLLKLTHAREMVKSRKAFLKGEGRHVSEIITETKGYLDGFYNTTISRLNSDIAALDKKLGAL